MAKDSVKTAEAETIADKIARELAEKKAAHTDKLEEVKQDASTEQTQEQPAATQEAPEAEEGLDPEFEAALNEPDVSTDEDVQRALADDDEEQALAKAFSGDEARAAAMAAAKKLRIIALDFQANSPDSHGIFGRAGHVFTLGELRDLVGLPRAG